MKTSRENPLTIYTDGSCKNTPANPGPGGWAFVVVGDPNIYGKGHLPAPQTNNTAEMFAVLEALRWVIKNGYRDEHILVRPDSTYVINGLISSFCHVESMTDFRNVPNGDIWRELFAASQKIRRLKFRHVKGHDGNKFNEMCDRIASRERKRKGR